MYITNVKELQSQFRIETVVEYYEDWQASNSKKKIKCPFHDEKTASYSISKIKNRATCFGGCGSSSPTDFVMKKENCGFVEAIEKCAAIHNLNVEYDDSRSDEQKQKDKEKLERKEHMLFLNKSVADLYFQASYKKTPLDKDVVEFEAEGKIRSLTGATVKKFGICQSSESWNFISSKGFDQKLLTSLGIIRERKDKSGHYDAFRNRQIFPIKSKVNGIERVVGFGARRLIDEKGSPKYLNSPDSIVYNKSELLFGFYEQERELRDSRKAHLMEGYWDVLTCFDNGFMGTVASCGTALTIKQAQLLKRYVDTVLMLFDNDSSKKKNAGMEAAKNALPILLEVGLMAYVVMLPEDMDPDDYVRTYGGKALEAYCEQKKQDALLWYIEELLNSTDKSPYAIDAVSEEAVLMLLKIRKVNVQQLYTKQIAKILNIKESTLILKLRDEQVGDTEITNDYGEDDLTSDQRNSLRFYGVYEHEHQYFAENKGSAGYHTVSNFVVNPLFLLDSPTDPKRLFEVVNKYGQKRLIAIEGAALIELGSFKRTVEPRGNFVFSGSTTQYDRIKSKIYDQMTTCYEIEVLGYHKDGFYAFGNGIYTVDKGFIGIDEHGIVEYKQKQYFLPAFSDIYKDSEEEFSDEKHFIYKTSAITFEKWSKLFCEVHGDKGKIALCFYLASLFRHSLKHMVKFPLLNLFGMPQSGKSLLLENLMGMFGYKTKALNLNSSTDVSFFNKLVTVRDGLIFTEEYKNSISPKKVEGLKGVFDDVGRERGQKAKSKNAKTQVHSTCVVAGQELPTIDIALFTRCIGLAFSKTEYSQAEKERADQLIKMRDTGELSNITAKVSVLRKEVVSKFGIIYDEQYRELKKMATVVSIDSRMIENNALIMTIYEVLKEYLKFPFDGADLFRAVADNMIRQAKQISNENEVSMFWDILEYLATTGLLQQGIDYKFDVSRTFQKTIFDADKKLIYLSFTRPFALYMEHHKKQFNKGGLPKSSLLHYLQSHKSYIGKVKNTRFARGRQTSAYVFDYNLLGISLNNDSSKEILAQANN